MGLALNYTERYIRNMNTRQALLDQALVLFAERGYAAVGVQEIVVAARVTKPTLYHYFGSKRGLLEAVMQTPSDELRDRLQEAAEYHGDLPDTLTCVVSTCFRFASERPVFYRAQLAMWFSPPNTEAYGVVAPLLDRLHRILQEMFERAAADHGNMKGRARRYAATLLGTINTYVALSLAGHVELTDELVVQAVHQFSHGIYS